MREKTDVWQGTLALMVLKTLETMGPIHGYGIARRNALIRHASKPNFSEGSISYPNFRDWQRDNKTLATLAVSRGTGYNLTGLGDAEEIRAELVSSDFFSLLGIKPVIGRLFAPHEDEIGREPLVIISEGFWQRKFGPRPDVLGNVLTLDGRNYTIVGVLPANFNLLVSNFRTADLYVPIGQFQNPALTARAAGLGIHGIARLKPESHLSRRRPTCSRFPSGWRRRIQTMLAVTAVLMAVAFAACYLPARRATRIDPMQVLRME